MKLSPRRPEPRITTNFEFNFFDTAQTAVPSRHVKGSRDFLVGQRCVYIITGHVTDRVMMTTRGDLPKGVRERQSSAGQTKAAIRRRERESAREATHTGETSAGKSGAAGACPITLLLSTCGGERNDDDDVICRSSKLALARPNISLSCLTGSSWCRHNKGAQW